MATSSFTMLALLFTIFSLASLATSSSARQNLLQCLQSDPSLQIYTPNTTAYSSVLQFSVRNLRFSSPTTRKPELIVTPTTESQFQSAVICSRKHGVQVRTRSGGHDFEGLSYVSDVPFILIDLVNYALVTVDAQNATAWVQSGSTLGHLYRTIAENSKTHGFPGGVCPTVGVGGHVSGGGYGMLMRKYGLAADNVIDVRLVNADGKILNRKSMGSDLFWAIRGGGGGSFGVVLSWQIKLVRVPAIVTAFTLRKTLEQGAAALVHRWQYVAHKLPKELTVWVHITSVNSTRVGVKTGQAAFQGLFLGRVEKLVSIMEKQFPELGMKGGDCVEMGWIQSALYLNRYPINSSLDVLSNRTPPGVFYYKGKSDYVTTPISEAGMKGIWNLLPEGDLSEIVLVPYGGRMTEIPESATPFPHRKNLYKIQTSAIWVDNRIKASRDNVDWTRRLFGYLTPYVSSSPRAAYFNYRDLDLGRSKNGTATYSEAKAWGTPYYKDNFDRLVKVKTKVDPHNFFRNEQSIPILGKEKLEEVVESQPSLSQWSQL